MDAVELHSGDYVERYNLKTMDRVAALARRMAVLDQDRVADYGCGNGMLLRALGSRSGMYEGVDFSADMIRSAEERADGLENNKFHCRDIVEFCNENEGQFDIAATLDFSEHIADEEFLRIYSAIRRSLRAGGRLYVHTPNLDFFMEQLKAKGILKQFPEHIAVRSGKQNAALLKQCGFRSVDVRTIAHYNVLKVVHPLRHLPFVGRYFAARLWIMASA